MQISQSEACNKLATHCFTAFHPMHAATCSGPWDWEKMSGWMELILGRKNNSTGKNLTLPESKFWLPTWGAGSVQCFNTGALVLIEFFPPLSGTLLQVWVGGGGAEGWAGIPQEHDPEQKRSGFSPLCVPEQDTKSPRSPWGHVGGCALTSQSEAKEIKKKSFSPQGINYNIISHYNYYRLLRYNNSSNYKLSSLSTILRGRLWWV